MKTHDLYGSTTDGGSDVKRMMRKELKLSWEWCIPHLSNAATKSACGFVDDVTKSKNPELTQLLKAIVKTVYQTKHVEVVGTLFEELCRMVSSDNSLQLLDYRSHRFLGLTRVVERILDKWTALIRWYKERKAKAIRDKTKIPLFPLNGRQTDLLQLMSLLQPISAVNCAAQAESATQVDVLLDLFTLRSRTLNPWVKLRDHRSLPIPAPQQFFHLDELTPLITATRKQLCQTFYVNFFKRYHDPKAMRECSFVFEMQLVLHPDFKDLERSLLSQVLFISQQHHLEEQKESDEAEENHDEDGRFNFIMIRGTILDKLSKLMEKYPT